MPDKHTEIKHVERIKYVQSKLFQINNTQKMGES